VVTVSAFVDLTKSALIQKFVFAQPVASILPDLSVVLVPSAAYTSLYVKALGVKQSTHPHSVVHVVKSAMPVGCAVGQTINIRVSIHLPSCLVVPVEHFALQMSFAAKLMVATHAKLRALPLAPTPLVLHPIMEAAALTLLVLHPIMEAAAAAALTPLVLSPDTGSSSSSESSTGVATGTLSCGRHNRSPGCTQNPYY